LSAAEQLAQRLAARRQVVGRGHLLPAPAEAPAAPAPKAVRRRTAFAGAKNNRHTRDWTLSIASPDQQVRQDLRTVRGRSRDLALNFPYAKRIVALAKTNLIGPTGIRLQVRVTDPVTGRIDRDASWRIEDAYADFSHKENFSADGKLARVDFERLLVETLVVDGEVLVRKRRGFRKNRHRYAVELIDIDRLDFDYNEPAIPGVRGEIRMGIERDEDGRDVAFYIWTAHPSEYVDKQRKRVPADEIEHLMLATRIGQSRGLPWLVAILFEQRQLSQYMEAELIGARIGASNMGFLVDKNGEQPPSLDEATADDEDEAGEAEGDDADEDFEVEPGMFKRIAAGLEVQEWNPQRPNTAYGAFTKERLRAIASGANVNYNVLTNDWGEVNYSSGRLGLQEERAEYRVLQRWLINHFGRPIYRDWLLWTITAGACEVDIAQLDRYRAAATWIPRGWEPIDPQKEATANATDLQNKLTSHTKILAERGEDFEELLAQIAYERELAEEYGVDLTVVATPAMAAAAATTPASAGDPDDDEDADAAEAAERTAQGTGRPDAVHPADAGGARAAARPSARGGRRHDVRADPHRHLFRNTG